MKEHYNPRTNSPSIFILFFLVPAIALLFSTSSAQQIESGNGNNQKREPLSEGVTEDWLNSLRDENGSKIINEEEPVTDALQRTIFNGENTINYFGYSVASAGDVNGDGFDDIIIGAYGYSSNTGRAYIYFGGGAMDDIADVILTGETTNNYFGGSVSSAGDVNGDGYDDIIVGAYGYSSNTGRAYIYFGGGAMDNVADVIMTGETTNNSFGISVSSAGDVNGDGYDDVIVGTDVYNRAYIYFGGASMNNTADVILTGDGTGGFGRSVSSAGDVNGDGYDDIIVGAYGYSILTGRAYIYFGGLVMDNIADVIMTGETTNNFFGWSVSSAGDVNGDGYNDVVVGAYRYSTHTGRAYIYFGGLVMDNIADVIMTGEATSNNFGYSVSSAGDVNGDGYADVIVGAYLQSSSTGKAYVYFGGAAMDNISDVTMTGEAITNSFGYSVSSAGDVNGDGYADIIVGAYEYSSGTGRVYLYDYFMRNEIVHDYRMSGNYSGSNFGWSVSGAGDLNGDGYSDVIISARGDSGKVYIYFGGASMDTIADLVMTGEATNTRFGWSVSGAGDVNGDGYDDFIVGAWGMLGTRGRAYIYFGGASMNNVADLTITGATLENFGRSVSSAGDVNGDGYSDVIVGATGLGRAYIFFGGILMDTIADVTMIREVTSSFFGGSVSSAGDVNGDGYDDVIVGAYQYSGSRGRAYIFLGGAPMDSIADLKMTGEAASINFGESVSSAGDVNGDGYSDIVIGAQMYSFSTGRAYIYFGGVSMDTIPDVTMTGEAMNSKFGYWVSSAGDVNVDGYDDVIVGAMGSTGRAFIYLGSAAIDNVADVSMTEELKADAFGCSVSGAGDVNGDGYADVIVGAFNYNSSAGRAYLYKGSAISAKPILNYVRDVPDDQGGKVDLKWARSSLEVYGSGNVHKYLVYRSPPPALNDGFKWEEIADINAVNNPFYYYEASTLQDSVSTYFQIIAKNTTTGKTWSSNIMYGSSIANIAPNITLNLTAFIQGFYNPSSDVQVSDTVTIQLRNSASPYAVADVSKAVIGTNGTAQFSFTTASPGNYYIAFKHRNSIETWSPAPISFSNSVPAAHDFTASVSLAYGSNMMQIDNAPVRFGIYNGDVDQDGTVDASDLSLIDNDATNFAGGYVPTDVNGDSFIDGTDYSIADNNATNFVSVIRP